MKTTYLKHLLQLLVFSFVLTTGMAQEYNSFDIRYQNNIKGDLTFIGNNIVNRDGGTATTEPEDAYNNLSTDSNSDPETEGFFNYNDFKNMQYIDVDGDPTTFSSSSSTFTFPQANCNLIRYAGLYWSATYPSETANGFYDGVTYTPNTITPGTGRQTDFNQVRFRVPGGTYVDVTADEVLFDGFSSTDPDVQRNSPYACYADVTALVSALANPEGEYTVANIRSVTGSLTPGGGAAGGWTLVIVYENPNLTGKLITTFDGFAWVNGSNSIDINYNGFNTIPAGPVNADIGVASLEGDYRIEGDGMSIRAASSATFTTINNATNPADNFFNSNITLDGVVTTNRTPASINTLGYDTDMFLLSNPANAVIPNAETDATFRFSTNGDSYYPFFNSFNVEIIEPNIVLEKRVEDIAGNDITGLGVNLGQQLDYVLSFVNTGNDDATNYTIRDVLPINVTLDELTMTLPTGVTYSYDSVNREIIFSIPDNLVEVGDPTSNIRMRVQVAQNCFDFIDACSNQIENLAFSTYEGIINDNQITDDPSVSDFDNCGFVTPGATNFLLDDLANCDFSRTVELCGDDVLLDAGDNFDSYTWYLDSNGNSIIDAGDVVVTDADADNDPSTLLVSQTGTYIVDKDVADPCLGFQEIIHVTLFGTTQVNPISTLINDTSNTVDGEVVVCPNDGQELPEIFLCGLNDTELIQINIPDADSIEWEQLDEASCGTATADCANTDGNCTWNNVANGNDFLAQDAGQYRLIINYQNGCFSRFYFNIYKNPLDPQYTFDDIMCGNPGNITVTNVPLNYEFQLLDATTNNVLVGYNPNPSFDIATNGIYAVEIRQQGVSDGCVFRLDDIGIRERNFQVDVSSVDTNCNGLGSISISVLDVEPQYYYEILLGGTSVDTFGPTNDNNHTFSNLNDGTYEVRASTDDGCAFTQNITINDVTDLAVSALVTKSIDCTDGTVELTPSGGFPNPDYFFAIWSHDGVDLYPDVASIPGSAYQIGTTYSFNASEAGDYEFIVVDGYNCSFISNEITITEQPSIDYTTSLTNETCFNQQDGTYTVNVINSNGYSLSYVLTYPDSSTQSNTSGQFTGLGSGGYVLTVTQTQGAISCDFVETFSIGGPTAPLSSNAVFLQDYTCTQFATIEAQNTVGGTPPYEYSIDGINFDGSFGAEQFGGLVDGTYTITVRDANGCTIQTNAITIDPFVEPSDLTFVASAAVCPANTSDVTTTVVDGEGPFLFEITSPATIAATTITGNSASFVGLTPDTYIFQVTDANGCSYDESFTIAPVVPIDVVGTLDANQTCFNDGSGAISFDVLNFSTDYNYAVTGPQNFSGNNETSTNLSFTGLDVGTYTIQVTDNTTNCTDTTDVTVNGPSSQLTITANETQPTCTAPGSVIVTASGGWGRYNFVLTNPDATTVGPTFNGNFSGLTQTGTFTATATDANGCSVSTTFTLTNPTSPILGITPNDSCYDDATGLTLTATVLSGGDGNYEYSLNGGAFVPTNSFTGLTSGTYTIEVRDGNNCTDTEVITINPEISVVANASNISACGSSTDINITPAGGDGNYVFAVVGDGVTPTAGDFSATNPISVNATGNYDVYVRDNNGAAAFCEASFDITIGQDDPLTIAATETPILCSGESNGSITITAGGGEAPYEYSNNGGTNYQVSNTFTNLSATNYDLVIRDANGCTVNLIYALISPQTLSASAAVTELAECNVAGAEVRISNVIGGTAPYEYSFDGGSNYVSSSTANLLPGTHNLSVRDANGCTFTMTVDVADAPDEPVVSATVSYECDGEGVITVNTGDPTYDYTYELNSVPNTPETSNIFNNVPVGNHTVTVNYTSNIPPAVSTLLNEDFGVGAPTAIPEIDPLFCFEPQDGNPSSCPAFGTDTHIQDGEYSVANTIVNPYTWLVPNEQSGDPNGRYLAINVGGVAGVGGIVYAKRNIEIIPNQDITVSLDLFNLKFVGSTGVDANLEIELVDPSGTVISSLATGPIPKTNNADDWLTANITLNPGANSNIDIVIRTIAVATGGNDVVIDNIIAVQSPIVCSQSIDIPVVVEPGNAFGANLTAFSNVTCNTGVDGSITFEVENFDTANGYEYSVNGGAFTAAPTGPVPNTITISGLAANNYTIEVRDINDNSCSVTLNQTISEPSPVVATASLTDVLTCANGGATITASASGGTPNYSYQLEDDLGGIIIGYDFTTNGTNTVFTGLSAGDYIIRARDTNNCEDIIDSAITVDPTNSIVFNTMVTNCYSGANDATIQINVTDGNGGYEFSLNGGPFIAPTPSTATSYTFQNLTDGTYTVDVRDGFGCIATQQIVTINPELQASAVLNSDLTCLVDASITINASGGVSAYSYEWSNDGGTTFQSTNFTGNTFTTNVFGTYIFRVTDSSTPANCTVLTNQIMVTEAQTPVISNITPTDILCNGDITGVLEITIDTSVGLAPYVINVTETITSTNYGTQTTSLPAGNYSVTITDAKGCVSNPFNVAITEPTPILQNTSSTNLVCTVSGTDLGTITIDASGGSPTYIYTVHNTDFSYNQNYDTSTGTNDHTFSGLDFGDYTVIVRDANNCESTSTITITTGPDILITTQGTAGCTPGSGEMDVTADTTSGTLGGGPFYFAIFPAPPFNALDPAWNAATTTVAPATSPNSFTFTGLTPGVTYTFVVHDVSSGCEFNQEATVPVAATSTMAVTIDTIENVTCTGAADGSVDFTVSGHGGSDINYELFQFVTNVTTGITGSISGIVGGPETETLSALAPGEYYLLLEEANGPNTGCVIASAPFTITQSPNLLQVTADSPQNDNCNPNEGLITAVAQFGTAPYEFQYLRNTDPAPTATSPGWLSVTSMNVESGNYIVYVKDANDCIQSDAVTVLLDADPQISVAVVDECVTEGNFEVLVTLNNPLLAISPFGLSLNGGPSQNITFNGSNQYTVSGISSGLGQTITITDFNGCSDTQNFDIHPPLQFNATMTTALDCEVAPANNAEITIEVFAGSGTYDFEIDGPGAVDQSRTAMGGTSVVWTDASVAGSYTVTVFDTSTSVPNCLGTITVDVPNVVVPDFTETHIDITCNGANDGSITLFENANGITPLSYSISPIAGTFNAGTNTFENLPAGNYTITATGSNSCTTSITGIIIDEPLAINVPAPSAVEFGCSVGNNLDNPTVTVDTSGITGGSGNFVVFEFIDTATTTVLQSGSNNSYTETNTAGRSIAINVYDDNGCLGTTSITIPAFNELQSTNIAIDTPISCSNSGEEITITAIGSLNNSSTNPADYEFRLLPSGTFQASGSFTGLGAGTHNFEVRNVITGCLITTSHTVSDPNTFTIDVNVLSDVICFGTQTGQVSFELIDATYVGAIAYEIFDTNGTPTNFADDISVVTGTFANNGPTAPESLFAGDYYVEITQTAFPECSNIEAFSIASPSAAITGDVSVTDITCLGNDGEIAIIDVLGGWGGNSYYVGTSAPAGLGSYTSNPVFSGLTAGTYQAWVVDSQGCEQQVRAGIVLVDPTAITGSIQINNDNCTNVEGEIEVVGVSGGQGSNYTYQLIQNGTNIGTPQTSAIFSNLGDGIYEVLIADQWSCSFTTPQVELHDEMNLTTTIVKPIDCSVSPDGEITVTVNGGSGNFDYTVTFPDAITTINNTTGVFVGLSQVGTYSFVVNDLDTAAPVCSRTITQNLVAPTPVTFDPHTLVNVSCNGGSDGSILINLEPTSAGVNDDPVYSYNLYDNSGALVAGPQTDPNFAGLVAGTYEVEAISSKSCLAREFVTITEPLALVVTASATPFACNAQNTVATSTITVTATDGSPGYLYSIDGTNYQSSNTFEVINDGTIQNITLFARDTNGCEQSDTVILQPINSFSAAVTQNVAISCVNPEEVLITVTDDGNPANNYTFELLPIGNTAGTFVSSPTNTTAIFDLNVEGSYTFRITDNGTGCYVDTNTYTIAPYDLIDVTATPIAPAICFGDANGALEITLSGYSGTYDYEIFDDSNVTTGITGSADTATNPFTITGLSGGNYVVRVTQTAYPFCTEDSNTITIASPDRPLTLTPVEVANVTCSNNLGEIEVSPDGGYAPFDFVLTNTTTGDVYVQNDVASFVFTGLSAGDYDVQVTDDSGCIITENISLIQPSPITAGISATPTTLQCFGDTSATVSATAVIGGQGIYQYQLNTYNASGSVLVASSGLQSSPDFNNLGAGVYSITISDGWSCGLETPQVTIAEPSEVEVSLVQLSALTCTVDAQLELTVNGGTGPYEYSSDGIGYNPLNGANTHTFSTGAGTYQFFVRDAFGCESMISNQIVVDPVEPIMLIIDETAAIINCTGESSATLIVDATGGLGNYSFELFTDAALTNLVSGPTSNDEFSSLSSGSYFVRVTSGDCSEVSNEIIITDPEPLQIVTEEFTDISCSGEQDGTISVEVTGGTGEIFYAISPNLDQFDTENVFTDLAPGVYDVIAQDRNGCFIPFQFTLVEPNPIEVTVTSNTGETCFGLNDGAFELNVVGGTGPYFTALDSNSDVDFVQDQTSFIDVSPGLHVVFVRDSQGCETNVTLQIEAGVNLNATVAPIYVCNGNIPENSLDIIFEDTTVIQDVMFALDSTDPADMQLDFDFSNVAPGDHFITIAHANGCINTIDFQIENYEPLTLVLEQNNINEITALVTGGVAEYTIYFGDVDNGSDNTYIINRTDTYVVTVIDQNGCEVSSEIFIEFIDVELPDYFTPDGDGLNDTWSPRNLEPYPNALTIIYDRYGRELYRMVTSDSPPWSGLYQGNTLPTGDYWYILKLQGESDDREFIGHFTLYR
ncbi:T9SS type B sorting domain-containing protein [Croceivirga thetidis]|uniref:T9SS type B sorting domain-containing protein n=1 Tax=Croceivirga thetidis TaxID=2721623 RepID=A0ABX1GNK5_9FLAO|nr:T9SS type B sorting domain-containing protein [Croceivirga thetidis]NKI31229.1 T9SS type B sorting domain-containing protein [Croceivirga thetidis]